MDAHAQNNLNLMRLILAWLVIVGHSYDLAGNTLAKEPLYALFGTIPSHHLAVNAFFIISGYLIAKSWHIDPNAKRFMQRRLARIVPGFLGCIAASVGVYTLAYEHDYLSRFDWPVFLAKLALLQAGGLPPAFGSSHYPVLNQSLWTIHYEFLCYIGLMLLGMLQLTRSRSILAACVTLISLDMAYLQFGSLLWRNGNEGHEPGYLYYLLNWIRFAGCYLAGIAWMQYEEQIQTLSSRHPIAILAMFVITLAISPLHIVASTVLLVPVLAWLAGGIGPFKGFWLTQDISYGLYLYGWPIQKLFVTLFPNITPVQLITLSTAGALLCGWLSWVLVERPALHWLRPLPSPHKQGA